MFSYIKLLKGEIYNYNLKIILERNFQKNLITPGPLRPSVINED